MAPDLGLWALQIYWLIGLYVVGTVAIAVAVVLYVVVRIRRWNRRRQRAERERLASRMGPDGRSLPPTDRGLCDRCGRYHETVSFFSDGRKLCPECIGCRTPKSPDGPTDQAKERR